MTEEFKQMSFEQLLKQREEIERVIQERAQAEKKQAIEEIAAIASKYKLDKKDMSAALALAADKMKPKPSVKYRNEKTGETWSGRGKAPAWIASVPDRNVFAVKTATDGAQQSV